MRKILVAFVTLICLTAPLAAQDKYVKNLAQISGEIKLPGLKAPVEVLRDKWGIPHIYAKNTDDLFFAQGFVAAQDRLFQLDMWRRLAVGEMAEVLGPDAIEADTFARLLRYRGDMDAEWKSYSPDTKQIATAFTSGINAHIRQVGKNLPIEFQILGYEPRLWEPEDILGRMSGIVMTRNFNDEIVRAMLIDKLGLEKVRMLMPTDPHRDFKPALDLKGIDKSVLAKYNAAIKPLGYKPSKTESNNWVISGALSASGKPMQASDPHRPINLPSLRYLVHLHAPGWNVIGAGEPALPGVALGHNERIAWGYTIVGTDQADIFVEETKANNAREYMIANEWKPMTIWAEELKVKLKTGIVSTMVELRSTRHGPVIHQDLKRNRAYALKWVGAEPGGAAYLGSLAVGRAQNQRGFLKSLEAWKTPSENFVYADIDGNIGWVATAASPIRPKHDGLLPVPGNGGFEWAGYLGVNDLPQSFNPKSGWIGTANHNILPKDYKHAIAYEFAAPFRYQRVKANLESKQKFTLEDFQKFQHDDVSIPGQQMAKLLANVKFEDANIEKYAKVMRAWDGKLSRDSQAGVLYALWLPELQNEVYARLVPKQFVKEVAAKSGLPLMLHALENPTDAWFGPQPTETARKILEETFTQAVLDAKKRFANLDALRWGDLHTVTFKHPLGSMNPEYAKAFNIGPFERTGDGNTPNNTRYDTTFNQTHGATYRHVLDLADWDKGMATSAPGQSAQFGSPHYGDLAPLWAKGEYFPLAYSRKKVEEVTQNRLVLTPAQ